MPCYIAVITTVILGDSLIKRLLTFNREHVTRLDAQMMGFPDKGATSYLGLSEETPAQHLNLILSVGFNGLCPISSTPQRLVDELMNLAYLAKYRDGVRTVLIAEF